METEDYIFDVESVINYAIEAIAHNLTFKEFAISMMDYIGGPNIIISAAYDVICEMDELKYVEFENVIVNNYTRADQMAAMNDWYNELQKEKREKKRCEAIKAAIRQRKYGK